MTTPPSKFVSAVVAGLGVGLILSATDAAWAFPKPKYPVDPASPPPAAAPAAPAPAPVVPDRGAETVADEPLPAASSRPPARAAVIRPPVGATKLASSPSATATAASGWSIYVVQPHDTLTGVSRRFGATVRGLSELNELEPKAALRPGAKLKLPPGTVDHGKDPFASGPAPATLASTSAAAPHRLTPKPAAAAPKGGKPSVAAAETPAKPGAALTPGETVARPRPTAAKPALGEAAADHAPAAKTSVTAATAPKEAAPVRPSKPAPPIDAAPASVAATSPTLDAKLSGRGRFIWPVQGDVVSRFGPLGPGQRNDGVNIATEAGAPVKAAAAGDVVYAGSSLPGFGNLVLLKHADGWVTAYAHLDRITVRMRDHVDQGQAIGAVGQSGGVDRPQLHFEARFAPDAHEKAKPVDPLVLLPR